MPESLRAAFCARASRVHARKGQMLIAQGSEADDVYLVLSGRLSSSVFSANGRETNLSESGPGRLLGEMAVMGGQARSANVVVVEDAVLALVSGAAFKSILIEVAGAGYWMAIQLAARIRDLTEKSSDLASLPVAARVVKELLRLSSGRQDKGDAVEIDDLPTHADLAARIGTHREAVTRELRSLARDGLVAQSGRRLSIRSLSALSNLLDRLSR